MIDFNPLDLISYVIFVIFNTIFVLLSTLSVMFTSVFFIALYSGSITHFNNSFANWFAYTLDGVINQQLGTTNVNYIHPSDVGDIISVPFFEKIIWYIFIISLSCLIIYVILTYIFGSAVQKYMVDIYKKSVNYGVTADQKKIKKLDKEVHKIDRVLGLKGSKVLKKKSLK